MNVDQLISNIGREIINPLILAMFAIALLYFLIGVLQYVKNAADSTKRKDSQKKIIYGVVGMVIMVSVYGIWRILLGTFNISDAPLQSIRKR